MVAIRKCYIEGMGIITPLGNGIDKTVNVLKKNISAVSPLTLFEVSGNTPLPVGEISNFSSPYPVPRIHQLTRNVADQAMVSSKAPPDAIVIGITTGGMLETEKYLKQEKYSGKNIATPELFNLHSPGTVSEDIANRFNCKGPVITISTACSSGTVAIITALKMIRAGVAKRVLAGGADSLCRLTYYGFNALQLIDNLKARPFDPDRNGMSVGEGAAMLLLSSEQTLKNQLEILGGGVSCDAYHVTTPHPKGEGAKVAMEAALIDSDISVPDIDYINLHGTGTIDNDSSEAKAITSLLNYRNELSATIKNENFYKATYSENYHKKDSKPFLSSIKGATGHSLAASGAIEAVVSAISIAENFIPANTGCTQFDPKLKIFPILKPVNKKITNVLSNSFGFGGNNASLVIGRSKKDSIIQRKHPKRNLEIIGASLITGAGNTNKTIEKIIKKCPIKGISLISEISDGLPPKIIRRLKRLPRMALCLAINAYNNAYNNTDTNACKNKTPSSIFMGTGWGALSETNDFLDSLFNTNEKFPSPTDFVGSVHNAPAGQIAMLFKSKGANITTTGGDYSFEQALMTAQLFTENEKNPFFLLGADESHQKLSKLFDPSISPLTTPADGGGAFCLKQTGKKAGNYINLLFYENVSNSHYKKVIASLIYTLGGVETINNKYGAVFIGIPQIYKKEGEEQINRFLSITKFSSPVIDYRKLTGQFASATATAAVLAFEFIKIGKIPAYLNNYQCKIKGESSEGKAQSLKLQNRELKSNSKEFYVNKTSLSLKGKACLIIGLGSFITAIKIGKVHEQEM